MSNSSESRNTFFRQSGWMMIATTVGGGMMALVHLLSKRIPPAEYATVGALLALTIIIPAMPLQMLFAQQTAAGLATGRERQVAYLIRRGWLALTLVWVAMAVALLFFQPVLMAKWRLSNPAALWATSLVILGSLWAPMFFGVLQGQQNFLWLGWAAMFNGLGRVVAAALIVFLFAGGAAGIMVGAIAGLTLAIGASIWQTRSLWSGPAEAFPLGSLLRRALPLVLGFGACQFLFSADTMLVKVWFPDDTAPYVIAGTMSRALMWLVLPLAAVMFPKLVQSSVRKEKTDVMTLTLIGTAVLGMGGMIGLWLFGALGVRIMSRPEFIGVATKILPWYAFAMVPLSLANVLVNDLLAREKFAVVPWLIAVAVAYPITLMLYHPSMISVLQILAGYCTLLFIVGVWFRWRGRHSAASPGCEGHNA